MKVKTRKYLIGLMLILLALILIAKFGKASLLKTYIEIGIGNCTKIPVLCILPESGIINPAIDKKYLAKLKRFPFIDMEIYMPANFEVIKEEINKVYYKKRRRRQSGDVAYLLYEKPNFFIDLFPKVKKQGINNSYQFLDQTMSAVTDNINSLSDAFFVIMKTVFTPDLGEGKNIKIVRFAIEDKKGFLTYNLGNLENYFDCNIINSQGDFFKVYIKDKNAGLDLDKVLTIISSVSKN